MRTRIAVFVLLALLTAEAGALAGELSKECGEALRKIADKELRPPAPKRGGKSKRRKAAPRPFDPKLELKKAYKRCGFAEAEGARHYARVLEDRRLELRLRDLEGMTLETEGIREDLRQREEDGRRLKKALEKQRSNR